ncbi:radical SAM family heme chaperone HemW [Anaerotruncus sp. 80]|uniref:Heme chaperone HemW n=1 Tax=Anaerotruncus colihominis TaxID=169435 RepID=A0A845QF59_9FIRM|nr:MULTISPECIES: radical SAM family heme chaperone HemW [Anaerotruncus]NBH60079.1 radical SAM family heme chaperone HemW [Anaerotruncus colihominis]NCF00733.1 radical SAM family heme chaperone HemW [Anaerotruncus sp. 80]
MTTTNKERQKLGIYIHIPFCLQKCLYCGFYSSGGSSLAQQEAYIEELLEDIKAYGEVYGQKYLVDTVFFGGGTPSILPASLIGKVMDQLRQCFFLDKEVEITIESNPKTLTKEKLLAYRSFGINRLSIGIQSFDDGILKNLGRAHDSSDAVLSFQMARQCGFDNINLDLMFAVPGHTMEIWEKTLKQAVNLQPAHISFYSLQIEEDTPYYEMFQRGEITEISDEEDRRMYHRAIEVLKEAGYDHYEISNTAKAGKQCRHNLKYWSLADYLGIGSGASSYVEGVRFTEAPFLEFHKNTREDDMCEFVFTGLRKTCGIDLAEFERRFAVAFWEVYADRRKELTAFLESGSLLEDHGRLRLSEAGIDISNQIMAVFV